MTDVSSPLSNILVASDLSDQAGFAVERAIIIAQESGSEVIVAHVVDEKLPSNAQSFEASTSDHLIRSRIASLPHAADIRLTIDIVTGRPEVDIAERARIEQSGLILVGLHNRLLKENLGIEGTIAEDIIRASEIPVLLVKDKPHGPYRRVLIGVDFSAYSRLAIRTAATTAPTAELHLVHAYHTTDPRPIIGRLSDASTHSPIASADRHRMQLFIEEEMQALRKSAPAATLAADRVTVHSREGYPRDVIRDEAVRIGADLIVLGTHGRVGLQRTLLGSVSADLINERISDVLVVRPY